MFWRGVFEGGCRLVVVESLMVYDEIEVGPRLRRFQVLYLDERSHEHEYVVMQRQLAIYTVNSRRIGEDTV